MTKPTYLRRCLLAIALVISGEIHNRAQSQESWVSQQSGFEETEVRLDWVTAFDANTGWIVGGTGYTTEAVLRTNDGGMQWDLQPTGANVHLHSMAALSADEAWVAGNLGTILRTIDGGATWTTQATPVGVNLLGIAIAPPSTLWAVGDGGTILKTADGGVNWVLQNSGTGSNFHGVAAVNSATAFAVGDDGILQTVDGGVTWQLVVAGLYKSVTVVDSNTIWAVELFGDVAKTTNGGGTWTVADTGSSEYLFRIAAANEDTAWIVGANGTLLKTIDDGVSWQPQATGTSADLFGVTSVGESARWLSGDAGTILGSSTIAVGKTLTFLGSSRMWVGLINSDDQGTRFDLRAEVYKNSTLVASGLVRCLAGVTRNPGKALEAVAVFGSFSPTTYYSGDVFAIKISTRIGTNSDDTKCSGHNNAVGLRLYYDAAHRPSSFDAEVSPDPFDSFFLHRTGSAHFLDALVPTGTVARFNDSPMVSFAGGNAWKAIGEWSKLMP